MDIIVDDGVYEPAVIESNAGEPLSLHFERRDASPCAEQVVFHGLDVSEYLPVGETTCTSRWHQQQLRSCLRAGGSSIGQNGALVMQ